MKNWFSVKLYIEGLKKIKVPGIACAIAVIALNAFLPIVGIIDSSASWPGLVKTVSAVSVSSFAPFSLMMMVFSAILVYSMFSFLNERNRADFWHAIPQTRTCAYVSLTASVYTWILGTILTSAIVNAILWGIAKYYSVSFWVFFASTGVYFLAAIMIAGFMTLAMTITGTTVSNLLILVLLLLFTRVMGAFSVMAVEELAPMFDISYSFWKILEFDFCLPYALINELLSGKTSAFSNVPLLLYSMGVVILVLVLGAVCYTKRKSETASKSAPNKTMQHIYRSAVTLPFVFFLAVLLLMEDLEPATTIILIIVAVLVWLIFELMTTKKIKSALKSLPLLIIPVLISALLSGALLLARTAIWNETPDAEDIKGITLGAENRSRKSYERIKTENLVVENDTVNQLVSNALKKTISDAKKGIVNYEYHRAHIIIHLESGRTIGRYINVSDDLYADIRNGFYLSDEYRKAQLSMPSTEEIREIWADSVNLDKDAALRLWASYLYEYSLLEDSQKQILKEGEYVEYWSSTPSYSVKENGIEYVTKHKAERVGNLYVSGTVNFETFDSTYPIYYELMPETAAMYLSFYSEQNLTLASTVDGELKEYAKLLDQKDSSGESAFQNGYIEFNVLCGDTACNLYIYQEESPRRMSELLELLSHLSDPDDYSCQNGKTVVNLVLNVDVKGSVLSDLEAFGEYYSDEDVYYYHYLRLPVALTAEEAEQLKEICIDLTPVSDK